MSDKARLISILFILSLGLWACESDSPEPANTPQLRELTNDERSLIEQSNELAFKLLNRLDGNHPDKNLFFSPASVAMTMGMLYNGAEQNTKSDIGEIIGCEACSEIQVNKTFNGLFDFINSLDQKVRIDLANSLWFDRKYAINELYRDQIMAYFGAETEGVNFSTSHSANYINRILGARLNKDLQFINPELSRQYGAVMLNAGAFTGQWAFPVTRVVEKHPFRLNNNSRLTHTFEVAENAAFNVYRDDKMFLVQAPYGNGQFSMIFLSANHADLYRIKDALQPGAISFALNHADTVRGNLYIPEIQAQYQTNLKQVISDLGFSFSNEGIFQNPTSKEIDQILHAAYLDQTNKTIPPITYYQNVGQSKREIKIDQPFYYFVREKHTGMILFAGKFLRPE